MTQDHWHIVLVKQFRKHTYWQPAATLIHPSITRIQVGGTLTFSLSEQLLPRSLEERESPKFRKEPPPQELVQASTRWRKATLKEKPECDNPRPYNSSYLQGSYAYIGSHALTTPWGRNYWQRPIYRRDEDPEAQWCDMTFWLPYLVTGTVRPRAQVIGSHALFFNIPCKVVCAAVPLLCDPLFFPPFLSS